MERKISVSLYLLALVFTILIFGFGVYVGDTLNRATLTGISTDIGQLSQQVSSAQLMFLLEDTSAFCPVYESELARLEAETVHIGQKLEFLETGKAARDDELKRTYFVLEAQTYLLAKKTKEKCISDDVLVLYFYSNADCDRCAEQGAALSHVRETLPGIRVYSFDGTLGSPVVAALQNQYGVQGYPSMVVDSTLYPGFQSREEIIKNVQK